MSKIARMMLTVLGGRTTSLSSPLVLPGLQIWLDASDLSTLFQDAAGSIPVANDTDPVGHWVDKSPARHVFNNITSGAKPVYKVNIQGGKSVVRFDGIDDRLSNVLSTLAITKNVSSASIVAVVANVTFNGADGAPFSFTTTVGAINRARLYKRTTNKFGLSGRRLDADTQQAVESSAAGASPKVLTANFLWEQAKGQFFENGTKTADAAFQTAGNTSDTDANAWTGSSSGLAFFPGDVCEIVICVPTLSDANRAKLEAYLQTKWSIA